MNLPSRDSAHPRNKPAVEAVSLCVRYQERVVLNDVSFAVQPGERVAVIGPNGAGKSTLFKVIAGVIRPTSGSVLIGGDPAEKHICVAYVTQRNEVDWRFPLTVRDVVMMGRAGQIGLLRRARPVDRERVDDCLRETSLLDLARRPIGELSGGQQQRMFIARALAQQAEIMLMDEPFTGLDVPSQEELLRVLDLLRGRGVTVLVATHDLSGVTRIMDKVLLLHHRATGFGPPGEVLTPANLAAAFGGPVPAAGMVS